MSNCKGYQNRIYKLRKIDTASSSTANGEPGDLRKIDAFFPPRFPSNLKVGGAAVFPGKVHTGALQQVPSMI